MANNAPLQTRISSLTPSKVGTAHNAMHWCGACVNACVRVSFLGITMPEGIGRGTDEDTELWRMMPYLSQGSPRIIR